MRSVLIIETSTDTASIALVLDGEIVAERSFVSDRRHNSLLFKPLGEILETHGHRNFEAVLVGSGPGSYSGTRVGIAAAQGAALVAGCKAVAIPSILATPQALSGGPCIACGDARRGSFWTARIEGGELISGPELTDLYGFDTAVNSAREGGEAVFSMEKIRERAVQTTFPTAAGLYQVWQNTPPKTRAIWVGQIPQPIYLAPPHITPSKKTVFR